MEMKINSTQEIRWHGRGGQGIVTGAKILAKAIQCTGKNVVSFPDYGPERRGAPIRVFNRISDHRIRIHTPVVHPDIVIVVDSTLLGNAVVMEGIDEKTVFIVNTQKSSKEIRNFLGLTVQNVYTVPADAISKKLFNREIPNSALLGVFSKARPDIIPLDVMVEAAGPIFNEIIGEELSDSNIKAIIEGYNKGSDI